MAASQGGEVESTLQLQPPENHHLHSNNNHNNNNGLPTSSLGRQSSIYSLTLDEFQHTLCESGRHFGSMNMDEFLTSIWTAEENHAHVPAVTHNFVMGHDHANHNNNSNGNNLPRMQPASLTRQGSLSLPEPLCRKTVDEVWAEIRKNHQMPPGGSGGGDGEFHSNTNDLNNNNNNLVVTAAVAATHERQVTFGEMTLEDFLVRAGVVREQAEIPAPSTSLVQHHQQQQQQYSMTYQNNNNDSTVMNPATYVAGRAVMGLGGSGGGVGVPAPYHQALPQQPPPLSAVYGGRMGNGSGGGAVYGHVVGGLGSSQASPASPDEHHQGGDGGNTYGLEEGAGMRGGGRKRITDGPVEVVVERRQRRMIKNRESAARSRARKQAYTVELEAELNQLKEENSNLKRALEEMERKRKEEERVEEVKSTTSYRNAGAAEKMIMMKRSMSCGAALL
ncbi:unnamed protein product [Cuscuta campestris]|uniref:BZIP domain-containing protein n=1 Tax=Cuscuta campestris TaxID=132261 RepID=A0A484K468_9ASTE|nr:unnamed protein product [Cuscuta campestris]